MRWEDGRDSIAGSSGSSDQSTHDHEKSRRLIWLRCVLYVYMYLSNEIRWYIGENKRSKGASGLGELQVSKLLLTPYCSSTICLYDFWLLCSDRSMNYIQSCSSPGPSSRRRCWHGRGREEGEACAQHEVE